MIESIATYIVRNYKNKTDCRKVLELMGKEDMPLEPIDNYKQELIKWLSGKNDNIIEMQELMNRLDVFDIDEYLRSRQVGKVRIPTVPIQLPTKRVYKGVSGIEEGVTSFLKGTVLSKSLRDVIIFSDHSLEHCIDNQKVLERWMRGLAAIMLKGIHVNIIHNINRPLHEMILGFESWLPMYMTGLVTPYYLTDTQSAYSHMMLVSGNVSFVGDAINGYPESGRYEFSKATADVARDRMRAEQLLSCARPLVDIYGDDRAEEFYDFMMNDLFSHGVIRSILTVPPIYTASNDLLIRIMEHNNLSEREKNEILMHTKKYRSVIVRLLQDGFLDQSISLHSRIEMMEYPLSLSLSGMFFSRDIYYTYEEYKEHIEETKAFAAKYDNYIFDTGNKPSFRNIQVNIHNEEYVVVSKNKTPTMHFVSKNPRIIEVSSDMIRRIIS